MPIVINQEKLDRLRARGRTAMAEESLEESIVKAYRDNPKLAVGVFLSLLRDGDRYEWRLFGRHLWHVIKL